MDMQKLLVPVNTEAGVAPTDYFEFPQFHRIYLQWMLLIASKEEIEDMARKGTWRKQRPAGTATSRLPQPARQQQQSQPPSQSLQSRSRRRSRARSRSTSLEISPSSPLPVVDGRLQRLIDSYQDDLGLPGISAVL
ncbi:hypothetical protein GGI19_002468 [Coemansia pectinata]|uniref:Uncharacterized protein n=1 Tax=Coemansia pectinata TaxID=1052879 RepID=A0A9W8LCG4_9FUNG|nr:hypothetical protein GGI19_002468 [Coemansia pectinata]